MLGMAITSTPKAHRQVACVLFDHRRRALHTRETRPVRACGQRVGVIKSSFDTIAYINNSWPMNEQQAIFATALRSGGPSMATQLIGVNPVSAA